MFGLESRATFTIFGGARLEDVAVPNQQLHWSRAVGRRHPPSATGRASAHGSVKPIFRTKGAKRGSVRRLFDPGSLQNHASASGRRNNLPLCRFGFMLAMSSENGAANARNARRASRVA